MRRHVSVAFAAGVLAAAILGGVTDAAAAPATYPTEELAEYVFACMASNGQTPDAMRRCSCSIDYIASQLEHEDYVKAETVMRMQQLPSGDDRIAMFRTAPWAKQMVERLRRAQVEAETRCF